MGSIDTTNNDNYNDDNEEEYIHDHDNITHHNENNHHRRVVSNTTSVSSWYTSPSSFNDITRDTNSSIIRTPLLEDHDNDNNDDVNEQDYRTTIDTDNINMTITDNNNDTEILPVPSLQMIIIRILFPWLSNDHPNDDHSHYYHYNLHHHNNRNTPWYYKYLIYKYDSIPSIIIGISTLIVLGILIGTISYIIAMYFDDNGHITTHIHYISYCFGYIYFIMWSISFYPQCVMILQRQTTTGLSIDFVYLNCLGFICYTIYNCTLYYNPIIIHQYQQRHHEHDTDNDNNNVSPIQSNDVAFAIHALFFCIILLLQVGYYNGIKQLIPSKYCCYILLLIFICILLYPIIFFIIIPSIQQHLHQHDDDYHYHQYQMIDYIYFLSYIKIGISCMKYIPQLYSNYIYHTTIGWNIWQIILDLFGGIFSILQLIYDSSITTSTTSTPTPTTTVLYHMINTTVTTGNNSNNIFNHNLPKFMLGNISIIFDILFMIQHYILYSSNHNNQNHNNPSTIISTTTSPTSTTTPTTSAAALTNDHIDTNATIVYHPIDNNFE